MSFLPLSLLSLLILAAASLSPSVDALRFGIVGDWGMGGKHTPAQTEIRSAAGFNEACVQMGTCNLTISCGDNIYTPDVNMGLRESFSLFHKETGPFYCVSGNHDNIGQQMAYAHKNKRWKWPKRYYDFVVPIDDAGESGHTAHFFALDSMDHSLVNGAQAKWLESALAESKSRWKILFAHFPVTGAGRHRREGSVVGVPALMMKYNAQVFFAGHDHILDVNILQGRTLPISGAMARGGMMLRGIAGKAHKFTLTQPGEFNSYPTDWPGHGFLTAELSANVMSVYAWDQYGGVMYTFSITHDWVRQVRTMPKSMENKFPPPEVVREALEKEKTLERGPGGGFFVSPDGDETPAPKYKGWDGAPATEAPAAPTVTPFKDEHPLTTKPRIHAAETTTLPPDVKVSERNRDIISRYVRFLVSSECVGCDRDVFANETFSIFVLGVDLRGNARIFLSTSKAGCAMARLYPKFAPGTTVVQPMRNQAVFRVAAGVPAAFVCLSVDAGRNFELLQREDDRNHDQQFLVRPSRTPSQQVPAPGSPTNMVIPPPLSPSDDGGQGSGSNSKLDNGQSAATTTTGGEMMIVAGMSLLVGVGIAVLAKSNVLENEPAEEPRSTSAMN